MNEVLLEAFRYGAWATKALIAACEELTPELLDRPAGGFGSILATLHHIVHSDAGYVAMLTGGRPHGVISDDPTRDLVQLTARVEETIILWERFLSEPVEADRQLILDEGKYECGASIVLAQALQHASAHREQLRRALAEVGGSPPDLQPWEYALEAGRARWLRGA